MAAIHIFTSIEEAINILKRYNKQIQKQDLSKDDIIKQSISSNIFRAFHNLNKKPSDIYRDWARKNFNKIVKKLNDKRITKNKYDKQLFNWIYSFIDHWNSQVKNHSDRIIFGPASKIVNLLIKTINGSNFVTNEKIVPFMNVPFDEYTLKPLRNIINDLTDVNYKIDIPKNPTMKLINTPDLYLICQKAVFKLCGKAKIYPIIYDYWSWNERH